MEDEQHRFLFYRLSTLALVEEIARRDGDPAEQMQLIRLALGAGHFEETDDVTREAERHVESATA